MRFPAVILIVQSETIFEGARATALRRKPANRLSSVLGEAAIAVGRGKPMPGHVVSKTYGTVSADRRKQMSGLEFVQGLADGTLPLNTIARTLGYDVAEAASGRVVVTAEPSDAHLNPAGTVHGGFSATLLDSCMGLAVQTTLEKGFGQTTLEFKISLLRPITPETGLIKAEGVVLQRGRRVGTAEGRITDSKGRLLAHGTTTRLIFEN
jgi:uncharacterized protein (TIGR00369 family)